MDIQELIDKTTNGIVEVINNSNLHPSIISLILANIQMQVHASVANSPNQQEEKQDGSD